MPYRRSNTLLNAFKYDLGNHPSLESAQPVYWSTRSEIAHTSVCDIVNPRRGERDTYTKRHESQTPSHESLVETDKS